MRYKYHPAQAKSWVSITLTKPNIGKILKLAKLVKNTHSTRSAEWLRLVCYIYAGEKLPEAVGASIDRLILVCYVRPNKSEYFNVA